MFAQSFCSLRKRHISLTLMILGAMLLWISCWVMEGLLTGQSLPAIKQMLIPAGPLSPAPSLADGIGGFLYVLAQACLLAPLVEEMFFRWLFCSIGYDAKGAARANWSLPVVACVSGLLFGLSHGFVYGFTYEMIIRMAVIGGLLGALWVLLKRRGASALVALGCCMFAHGAYNFVVTASETVAVRSYELGKEEATQTCREAFEKLVTDLKKAFPDDFDPKTAPIPSPQ